MYKEQLLKVLDKTFLNDSFGFGVDTYRKWRALKKKIEMMNENQAKEFLSEITKQEMHKKVEYIKQKYRLMKADLISRRDEFAEKAREEAKDVARDISDEKAEEFWKKRAIVLTQFNKKLRNLVKWEDKEISNALAKVTHLSPKQLGGVVTATLLIALSVKAAETFTEYAKDKCFRVTDRKKRELCISRWKQQYYKKRLTFLRDHLTKCKFSRDPVKCNDKIDKEMLRVRKHLDDLKGDVLEKYADIRS